MSSASYIDHVMCRDCLEIVKETYIYRYIKSMSIYPEEKQIHKIWRGSASGKSDLLSFWL